MRLPRPGDRLGGCVWLSRIIAKARQLRAGQLPPEYASRLCHPGGVDGQFLEFFGLDRDEILRASALSDAEVTAWFAARPKSSADRIAQWNHLAENLGRAGFPLADRLPVALSTTYCTVDPRSVETVFDMIEADEADPAGGFA